MMRRRVRPVAAALLAAACVALPSAPAPAAFYNQLTKPGTAGVIRIRSLGEQKGNFVEQSGWGDDPATNPNRTVGDAEPPPPKGGGIDCFGTPEQSDCYRQLEPNDPTLNPSASGASYHAGDMHLLVNEVKGFLPGDTILIGSPYCNTPTLSDSCDRYIAGTGYVAEYPSGEVAHIAGGQLGPDYPGPGVLDLAEPLAFDHAVSEQVVKLPALYAGLAMDVAVPNAAFFVGAPFPPTPPLTVTATFIPPAGRRTPWDSTYRRPLYHAWNDRGTFQQHVYGTSGETTFFIPREVLYEQTVGNTFDPRSNDSWYSVEVSATDASGRVVADGTTKFKVNQVTLVGQHSIPSSAKQGSLITTVGYVADATTPAATSRHIGDVEGLLKITPPSGGAKTYKFSSCFDSDPTAKDRCGAGGANTGQYDSHGGYTAQIGGWRCTVSTDGSYDPSTITFLYLGDPKQCQGTYGKRSETQYVGIYKVHTTLKGVSPAPPAADSTFEITPFLLGTQFGI